ncbi:hypothetical protein J6590_102324 [Homalodisca vitripennis]|nr:hypothetical protein J6590_102324 [Homalodisca vitripennis]
MTETSYRNRQIKNVTESCEGRAVVKYMDHCYNSATCVADWRILSFHEEAVSQQMCDLNAGDTTPPPNDDCCCTPWVTVHHRGNFGGHQPCSKRLKFQCILR